VSPAIVCCINHLLNVFLALGCIRAELFGSAKRLRERLETQGNKDGYDGANAQELHQCETSMPKVAGRFHLECWHHNGSAAHAWMAPKDHAEAPADKDDGAHGAMLWPCANTRVGGTDLKLVVPSWGGLLILDALGAFHSQTSGLVRSRAHSARRFEFHAAQLNSFLQSPKLPWWHRK
jgi:hypothetical protein